MPSSIPSLIVQGLTSTAFFGLLLGFIQLAGKWRDRRAGQGKTDAEARKADSEARKADSDSYSAFSKETLEWTREERARRIDAEKKLAETLERIERVNDQLDQMERQLARLQRLVRDCTGAGPPCSVRVALDAHPLDRPGVGRRDLDS